MCDEKVPLSSTRRGQRLQRYETLEETQPMMTADDEKTASEQAEELAPSNLVQTTFWFAVLFVISIVMTVGNKFVMVAFKYPNLVTLMQTGTCTAALALCKAFGIADIKPITLNQWLVFLMTAVLLAIQIVSMLYALPLVAIATTVSARTIVMIVVALIDFLFFDKTFTLGSAGALVVATIGMVVYALNDVNYNRIGYLWLLVNSIATVIATFWNKVYITQFKKDGSQSPQGISLIQQAETMPLVAAMALHNNEFVAVSHLHELELDVQVVLFVTCIGGLVIGVAFTQVYALASGTSVMLVTTIARAVSIIFGHMLFSTVLSNRQVAGLVVCILGGVGYSLASGGGLSEFCTCGGTQQATAVAPEKASR
jgi:drug/metabolite transporter (DMT)-like permease